MDGATDTTSAYKQQQMEEEFIDMDISSTTTTTSFYCCNISSPPHSNDFEFHHLSSNPLVVVEDSLASPADELFYKGKLLPLHLPPRLQMVEKLLSSAPSTTYSSSLGSAEGNNNTTTTFKSTYSTPLESCNISPSSSCYVSGELNPEEYNAYPYCSANHKKSWSKKLKELSLSIKQKASRTYFRSFFTKSSSDCSSAASKPKNSKTGKKSPFLHTRKERSCIDMVRKVVEEEEVHRKSFSSVIGRKQATKNVYSSSTSSCSSSSTSSSFSSAGSNEHYGPAILKRSSSARSEAENPIQGAIAYCKKSQQIITTAASRKSVSDVGYCSKSAAIIAATCDDNKDNLSLCRG